MSSLSNSSLAQFKPLRDLTGMDRADAYNLIRFLGASSNQPLKTPDRIAATAVLRSTARKTTLKSPKNFARRYGRRGLRLAAQVALRAGSMFLASDRWSHMSRFLVFTFVIAFPFAGMTPGAAGELKPILGRKGQLLLEEEFEGQNLPNGWIVKAGRLRLTNGTLRAGQNREAGKLGLFSREQPMQDAVIQIDFKFDGARGINVSVNASPGELTKHGHLYSVMISPRMWNITEHNDKSDRKSQARPWPPRAKHSSKAGGTRCSSRTKAGKSSRVWKASSRSALRAQILK